VHAAAEHTKVNTRQHAAEQRKDLRYIGVTSLPVSTSLTNDISIKLYLQRLATLASALAAFEGCGKSVAGVGECCF
jgi:hypothetical protein